MIDDVDNSQASVHTHELRTRFERDVLPLAGDLRLTAWGYTRSICDAEDLVQETLLRAFRAFHSFEENTYLKAWLLTIMRNTWINGYRAAGHRPAERLISDFSDLEGADPRRPMVDMTASAEQRVLHHDFDADIQRAVLALTTELRKTLYLVAISRMRYRAVAEVLGVSHYTVSSRMHRIRRVLRKELAGFEREPPPLCENETDAA
jgi:RNA polymerase sigma-70 factor (ECF subfamily)